MKEKLPEDDTDEALAPKNKNNNYKKMSKQTTENEASPQSGSQKTTKRALLEKQTSFGFYFKTHEK